METGLNGEAGHYATKSVVQVVSKNVSVIALIHIQAMMEKFAKVLHLKQEHVWTTHSVQVSQSFSFTDYESTLLSKFYENIFLVKSYKKSSKMHKNVYKIFTELPRLEPLNHNFYFSKSD